MDRPNITRDNEEKALNLFKVMLERCKMKKGIRSFSSIHEIFGVISEEYLELGESIKTNDHSKVIKELADIMVASFWGLCCIDSKKVDW